MKWGLPWPLKAEHLRVMTYGGNKIDGLGYKIRLVHVPTKMRAESDPVGSAGKHIAQSMVVAQRLAWKVRGYYTAYYGLIALASALVAYLLPGLRALS